LVGRAGWGSGGNARASTLAFHLTTPPLPLPTRGRGKYSGDFSDRNQRRRRAPRRAFEPAVGAVSFQPDAVAVPAAHGGGPAPRVDPRRQILAHPVATDRRAFAAVAYRRG